MASINAEIIEMGGDSLVDPAVRHNEHWRALARPILVNILVRVVNGFST